MWNLEQNDSNIVFSYYLYEMHKKKITLYKFYEMHSRVYRMITYSTYTYIKLLTRTAVWFIVYINRQISAFVIVDLFRLTLLVCESAI